MFPMAWSQWTQADLDVHLQLAASEESTSAVIACLEAGANLHSGPGNWTPLHGAAVNHRTEVMVALLDRGAPIDARDPTGCTPLHWAAALGHTEAMGLLLERGAGTDERNEDHQTPLHLATLNDRRSAILWLLAWGAQEAAELLTDPALDTPTLRSLLQLDALDAAAALGNLPLLRRVVAAQEAMRDSPPTWSHRLAAAMRHAMQRERHDAIAYLQACQARMALKTVTRDTSATTPL